MAEQNPSPTDDHGQLVPAAPGLPSALGPAEGATVEAEDARYIRVPPADGGEVVLVPARPLYDALAQLSFTMHNGNGWTSNIEAIAWCHLGDGIDPFQDYTYSTYEEVLVDLYVVAALCVPYGWWPIEADEEDLRSWMSGLQAVSLHEWNQSQREQGYVVIDDPAEALQILAATICEDPYALAEYERKSREELLPKGLLSIHDVRGACTTTWPQRRQDEQDAKARRLLDWMGIDPDRKRSLVRDLSRRDAPRRSITHTAVRAERLMRELKHEDREGKSGD